MEVPNTLSEGGAAQMKIDYREGPSAAVLLMNKQKMFYFRILMHELLLEVSVKIRHGKYFVRYFIPLNLLTTSSLKKMQQTQNTEKP